MLLKNNYPQSSEKSIKMREQCTTPNRPFFVRLDTDGREAKLIRPRCGMWRCKPCSEMNAFRWSARAAFGISEYMKKGERFWFVTLTSHEKLKTRQATQRVFQLAFPKLYKRMKRACPNLIYISIPEQHKNGRLHVHILINHGFGKKWLKDNGRECGLGYKADESEIDDVGQVIAYVVKYLGKQVGLTLWSAGFRRVRTSAHFPNLPEQGEDGWIMLNPKSVNEYIVNLLREGYAIENDTLFEIKA